MKKNHKKIPSFFMLLITDLFYVPIQLPIYVPYL